MTKKIQRQKGQAFVLVVIVIAVVLFTTLLIIAGARLSYKSTVYSYEGEKAIALAEAGLDKAVASLNKDGNYIGQGNATFGDGEFEVEVTTKDAGTKIIQATGYIPDKVKPRAKRTVKVEATKGVGVSFVYGIQVGEGGLELGHGNRVEGSIYSNGNIIGDQNNEITGDAWVAGGPQGSPNQETDCSGVNCQDDYFFGKSVSGEVRLDIAQSFKPSTTEILNKIAIKIKKIGNPPDVTVRIMDDNGGEPDKNNVLTSGILYSSLVELEFGWIDVAFSSSPSLSADTTYWIVIDTSSNNSNYWAWQNDLAQSYTRGQFKWSPNWNTGNPSWNSSNGDLSFKVFMGGVVTSLKATNINFHVSGNVHANTIDRINIDGDAYYQVISNSAVGSISYPGSIDPPPKVFPISEANILAWKTQAETGGILGAPPCGSAVPWGPGKYTGDIILNNGCILKVNSPIWIAGNVTLNNDNIFTLDSGYGSGSGLILVDGVINMNNNNKFLGTGQGNSLLMLLSTYDSRIDDVTAIDINNNGNTGVFYANNGIIRPGNNNQFKELTAWKIKLVNNSTINYETGLSSTLFTSGPGGSFTLVKGTYQGK